MKSYTTLFLFFLLSIAFVLSQDANSTTIDILPTPTDIKIAPVNGTAKQIRVAAAAGKLHCETSGGSPLVSDIYLAANVLRKDIVRGCQNTNDAGSRCTQMKDRGTAALGICGEWAFRMTCYEAGGAAGLVAAQCASNVNGGNRAGGYVQFDHGKIIVYHS